MRITDVCVEIYRWPRERPIRNGKYVYTHAGLNVVRIRTDEGIEGIGLGAGGTANPRVFKALVEGFKPILLREDPLDVERLWHQMWRPKLVGRRGLSTRAISAVDIALWDIRGKVSGLPLYKLLGGYARRVPAYIAGGYYEEGKTLEDLAREMQANVELGATAVKMKIGGAPINEDVERVRVVRQAVGPHVKVMVDANNAYRYYEAIEMARKIEQYDVFWFEEPVEPDDYRGQATIARSTGIPIASGENEYTRYGFRDLIEHQAAAILQPDALILGGITEFMKVSALAQAYDLPIAPHGNQDIHVHLVCAIPNGLIVEYYRENVDPAWGRAFKEHLKLVEGHVSPPDKPGHGIELNDDFLARYRVA